MTSEAVLDAAARQLAERLNRIADLQHDLPPKPVREKVRGRGILRCRICRRPLAEHRIMERCA